MPDYRFRATVEIDVMDAESEAQARKAVFSLLTTQPAASKGRPSSGPKASVTGVTIPPSPYDVSGVKTTGNPDVME